MAKDFANFDNLEVDKKKNMITISVNPKFYNLDVVYSAIYLMLEKNYFKIDGDPEEEIIVRIEPKNKTDLLKLGMEFNNQLINYAAISHRGSKTQDIRKIIVEKAIGSQLKENPEKKRPSRHTFPPKRP